MTIVLERTIALANLRVAALVRQTMHQHATAHYLAVRADRRPVALLIGSGSQLIAFAPTGEPMGADEVERLCPGATAQLLDDLAPSQDSTPSPPTAG